MIYSFIHLNQCLIAYFKGLEDAAFKCFQKGFDFGIGGIGALGSKPINPES